MKLPLMALLISVLAACQTSPAKDVKEENTLMEEKSSGTDTTAANGLTEAEKSDGWELLFDGKSLDQWRTYRNKPSNSWSVKDGTLYCAGSATDKSDLRADLITRNRYEDFEFSVDWKISPQGNSGIIYRLNEDYEAAYLSGPEYQLIDDLNFPEKLEDWQKTGANYAMNAAPEAAPNPVGEWNNSRIRVEKNHVEHWLNGKKIVEYELGSENWKAEKAKGKWKDAPAYGTVKAGHIALQDHGSEAWFKNIKIRPIKSNITPRG